MLFKNTLFTAVILSALAACAGHSTRTESASFADRGDYITNVNKHLNDWNKRAERMPVDSASKLRASIADARVDVRYLEMASEGSWSDQQRKVDQDLARIRNQFNLAE